jgi:hypothetical protein
MKEEKHKKRKIMTESIAEFVKMPYPSHTFDNSNQNLDILKINPSLLIHHQNQDVLYSQQSILFSTSSGSDDHGFDTWSEDNNISTPMSSSAESKKLVKTDEQEGEKVREEGGEEDEDFLDLFLKSDHGLLTLPFYTDIPSSSTWNPMESTVHIDQEAMEWKDFLCDITNNNINNNKVMNFTSSSTTTTTTTTHKNDNYHLGQLSYLPQPSRSTIVYEGQPSQLLFPINSIEPMTLVNTINDGTNNLLTTNTTSSATTTIIPSATTNIPFLHRTYHQLGFSTIKMENFTSFY